MDEAQGTAAPSCDDGSWVRVAPYVKQRLNLTDFNRTPFGSIPETMLHRFGVWNEFTKKILSCAEPYCTTCRVTLPKVGFERAFEVLFEKARDVSLSPDGLYVAAVPSTTEVSLLEHMELLDSGRAIVEGRLVKQEDIEEEVGLPVLSVGATPGSLKNTVQKWRTSGGGVIKVFYFQSRTSEGIELYQFSDELRCFQCGELHGELSLQRMADLPPCSRCKGVGWFLAKDRYDLEVLHACLDCSGCGAISSLFDYRFSSLPLRDLLTLSFQDLHKACASVMHSEGARESSHWSMVIEEIARSPLGHYSCGTPLALLSYDERVVLTALQCLVVGYRGRPLLFDLTTLSAPAAEVRDFLEATVVPKIAAKVVGPRELSFVYPASPSKSLQLLSISDVIERGVKVECISFPKGASTLLLGGIEGAHVKLLEIIHNRFLKRKKFLGTCNFADCAEVLTVYPRNTPSWLVADLLDIEESLAELYATTASAKKAGLVEGNFKAAHALLDCPSCGQERESDCKSCQGASYDWRLSTVRVGSLSFQEAVHLPLSTLVDSIVLDDSADYTLREVIKWVPETTTLGTMTSSLSSELTHFLFTQARLVRAYGTLVLGKKTKRRLPLILVESPFTGVLKFDTEIETKLDLLCKEGATVVSAGGALGVSGNWAKVFAFRKVEQSNHLTPYFHERYALMWEPFEYSSVSG